MTLEELETKLDELLDTEDVSERAARGVELKLAMRDYKRERDETEEENDSRITALESDVAARDNTIAELRESNTRLADKYGAILLSNDMEDKKKEEDIEVKDIDEYIKKFD